jgi:hypothetical protein
VLLRVVAQSKVPTFLVLGRERYMYVAPLRVYYLHKRPISGATRNRRVYGVDGATNREAAVDTRPKFVSRRPRVKP